VQVVLETYDVGLLSPYRVPTLQFESLATHIIRPITYLKLHIGLVTLLVYSLGRIYVYVNGLDLVAAYLKYVSYLNLYWLSDLDKCTCSGPYVL
jgi:hypothetical protein